MSMPTQVITLRKGQVFDPSKLSRVTWNDLDSTGWKLDRGGFLNKPPRGLIWTSDLIEEDDDDQDRWGGRRTPWLAWAVDEYPDAVGDVSVLLRVRPFAHVLRIESTDDYLSLPSKYLIPRPGRRPNLNFEEIFMDGYDAVSVAHKWELLFADDPPFYGWDAGSTVWLDSRPLEVIAVIPTSDLVPPEDWAHIQEEKDQNPRMPLLSNCPGDLPQMPRKANPMSAYSGTMPNPMSPGFARFVQAQNEIGASDSIDDLLAAYLFHRIRHQVEEEGYFSDMLDQAAIDKAKELGVMPIRTYGMSDYDYDRKVLKELTQSGRFNRYYVVEDRRLLSPIQGHGDPLEAMRELREMRAGEQIDLFGEGPRVMSAKALVRRYIGIEDD